MYTKILNWLDISGEKRNNLFILFILICLAILVTSYKILVLFKVGLQWDSFDFLADAYYFAGYGFGYVDFYRPPILPLLTSIPVGLGLTSELSISLVDGIIFIMGVIGLYQLFRLRFNNINSFIGVLFYISFPVVLLWLGVGYTDLASLSISIWAVYFTILALKNDSRFFIISWPLLALAFLTRFSAALFIFPIFFFLIINRNSIKRLEFILGIIISLTIITSYLIFVTKTLGDPSLVFLNFYSNSASTSAFSGFAHNMDPLFYIKNSVYSLLNLSFLDNPTLPLSIGFLMLLLGIISAIITGIIIYFNKIRLSWIKSDFKASKYRIILLIIFFIIFILTISHVNYLISNLFFLIFILILYDTFRDYGSFDVGLDLLFLVWLVSFLVFISYYPIKVTRYLIMLTPVFAYFIIVGWSEFQAIINQKYIKLSNLALIFILILSITAYLYELGSDPVAGGDNFKIVPNNQSFVFETFSQSTSGLLYQETYNTQDIKNATQWLKNYDSNYATKNIYSDYFWPIFSWNLKKGVGGLSTRSNELNNDLKNNNVDYFFAFRHYNLPDYDLIMEFKTNFGYIVIYKRG